MKGLSDVEMKVGDNKTKSKFGLGEKVQSRLTGTYGEILLIRGLGTFEYFIDPLPGADAWYEYMWMMKDGELFFVAGNWYAEDELELFEEDST
jgi:hypothetical protein